MQLLPSKINKFINISFVLFVFFFIDALWFRNFGCSAKQFQFAMYIFEEAQDFTSLSQFVLHALHHWERNFYGVIAAIRKHVMFFVSQEILQKVIDLLPKRVRFTWVLFFFMITRVTLFFLFL